MAREQLTEIDMNLNKVTNLGAPTVASDAATRQYVDDLFVLLSTQETNNTEDEDILIWMCT